MVCVSGLLATVRMTNGHTLIVGRSGAGKTALVRALIPLTARAIVLDREIEYDGIEGAIYSENFRDAAGAFLDLRARPFVIVFRPDLESDYTRLLQLAEHVQAIEPHGPLVVFMEEATAYSDTWSIDDTFRDLYNLGRKRRISLCSTVQVDTDVHRVTRYNSNLIVTLAQNQLTGPLANKFRASEVQSLVALDSETRRVELQQGRHFLVYPPGVDLFSTWENLHGYLYVRAGAGAEGAAYA